MTATSESHTGRGFECIDIDADRGTVAVRASSAIGDYEHSLSVPGSSYLWLYTQENGRSGAHLNREDVTELVERLSLWLAKHSMHVDAKC